jgi:PAS domain S-box-containing protein
MILEVIDSLTIRRQQIQDTQGRWYSMTIRPYKTVANMIDGALVTLEDINDLKQGMQRIKEARDYAEAIVETVREPLLVLSKDLHVVTANQAYYKNFAVTAEAIENKYFFELQDGLWNMPRLRKLLEDTIRENAVFSDFDVDYEAPGAGRRIMLLNGRRIAREESELILLAVEDITARRMAEENINKLNAVLQHNLNELAYTNKELEAFTYSVSHDLGAPLRSITGFAKILVEDYQGRLDAQGNDYLARIQNNSVKMEERIKALLHLTKISRQELERTQVDLSRVASTIAHDLREAGSNRSVEVVIAEGLTAFADLSLLKVALSQLFENAWKFTSKTDNPRIEFGAIERDGKTVYSVRENGAGFDQSFAEKLFFPFQRLHSEEEFDGTGIGLAIVERVIRRHGGTIWAEGEPGKGATFYFTLQ